MTAIIPNVKVYMKNNAINTRPGMAGKIAVIGAFKTTTVTTPTVYTNLDDAQTALGTDDTFNGCAVLPYLFKGASSILAVNIATESSGTWTKTINPTNLGTALASIKGEDWDILFVADTLTDAFITLIDTYLDSVFEMKLPAGFTGCLNGTTSANVTSANKCGEHCYGVITQSFTVNDNVLTLLQSIAYYTGLIAGMNVGNTMTMKTVDGVTALNSELSFETGGDGKTLLEAGVTTFRCANRGEGRFICVNSEQPNGYDLYINRVRDFVIKEFALHKFLGERNRQATLNEIEHMLASTKEKCVTDLDLLEDIEYHVVKKNANCVDVYIDSLTFAGLITEIDVYVTIEVE